jgi:hypothetical protein
LNRHRAVVLPPIDAQNAAKPNSSDAEEATEAPEPVSRTRVQLIPLTSGILGSLARLSAQSVDEKSTKLEPMVKYEQFEFL